MTNLPSLAGTTKIIDCRHPSYWSSIPDWDKYRLTFCGGEEYRQRYLMKFATRESDPDFDLRRRLTPIPSFAKAALTDIRNSIYQRLRDVTRSGGSLDYRESMAGNDLGVDRRGSSMATFLGIKVLTELLVMGRTGIFVDNSPVTGETLADSIGARPYLYSYCVEDILSWSCSKPDAPSEFQSVVLRDSVMEYGGVLRLPTVCYERYRALWINEETGYVMLQFYDKAGNLIDKDGNPAGPVQLGLTQIPFVMVDIGDSLLKDVCEHQIALLNLGSRDVWYALQANFPFYVEQRDSRSFGGHLKNAATEDGTAQSGGQGAADNNIVVGAQHGRSYGVGLDAPSFINPSPDPLRASIELQKKLEDDVRKLVNLAVQALGGRASSVSRSFDNQGLEAGLSFIGLVLESAERQVSKLWASYEQTKVSKRQIATIKYPDTYSLRTDEDRIKESNDLAKLMFTVPGRNVKKEIAKNIVQSLLGGKVSVETIDSINSEIDGSDYLTSDPDTIISAFEQGIIDGETASTALGFKEGTFEKADKEKIERATAILEAQSKIDGQPGSNPGARGVSDLAPDKSGGSLEKKQVQNDPTRQGRRVRGKGNRKPTGE